MEPPTKRVRIIEEEAPCYWPDDVFLVFNCIVEHIDDTLRFATTVFTRINRISHAYVEKWLRECFRDGFRNAQFIRWAERAHACWTNNWGRSLRNVPGTARILQYCLSRQSRLFLTHLRVGTDAIPAIVASHGYPFRARDGICIHINIPRSWHGIGRKRARLDHDDSDTYPFRFDSTLSVRNVIMPLPWLDRLCTEAGFSTESASHLFV